MLHQGIPGWRRGTVQKCLESLEGVKGTGQMETDGESRAGGPWRRIGGGWEAELFGTQGAGFQRRTVVS